MVELTFANKPLLIAIEAKLWSSKSSLPSDCGPPNDQLAKEWDNLRLIAMSNDANAFLIFLTADLVMPRREIEQSIDEFALKRPGQLPPQILWLGWHQLYCQFSRSAEPMLNDLARVADRFNFKPLAGAPLLQPARVIRWTFAESLGVPALPIPDPIQWEFANGTV